MPKHPREKHPEVEEVAEVVEVPVEAEIKEEPKTKPDVGSWLPKTTLGKKVKSGEITNIDQILNHGLKILEPEIVDALILNLESDLIRVGQSKGKFGGGKRSIWKQTQKKTKEGNKPKFATMAVIGNKNGYIGIGYGKAKETVPAREKAIKNAKLNMIKISRGCGSWECSCKQAHSIPFKVTGKVGSTIITIFPAPRGTGLIIEKECAKLLQLTGIKDVYSKTFGQTKRKINLVVACFSALKNLTKTKIPPGYDKQAGLIEGLI